MFVCVGSRLESFSVYVCVCAITLLKSLLIFKRLTFVLSVIVFTLYILLFSFLKLSSFTLPLYTKYELSGKALLLYVHSSGCYAIR